ncbi:MAG: recombinase, partial [Defluviitaleaceae bacterium]|nr:recombinase [Defluviitaleaceae bacterium]
AENSYFQTFLKHKSILELNRELLVDLIDIILLHDNGTVEIKLNFDDQYKRIVEYVANNSQSTMIRRCV